MHGCGTGLGLDSWMNGSGIGSMEGRRDGVKEDNDGQKWMPDGVDKVDGVGGCTRMQSHVGRESTPQKAMPATCDDMCVENHASQRPTAWRSRMCPGPRPTRRPHGGVECGPSAHASSPHKGVPATLDFFRFLFRPFPPKLPSMVEAAQRSMFL